MKSAFPRRIRISFVTLFALASLLAQQVGSTVISKSAPRGRAIGNAVGEYMKLYNTMLGDVVISHPKLQYHSAAGVPFSPLVRIPTGTMMKSHAPFLLARPAWAGFLSADLQWTGSGKAESGNIRFVPSTDIEMDRVGFGGAYDAEGTAAAYHGGSADENSIERAASAISSGRIFAQGGSEELTWNAFNSCNNINDIVQTNRQNPQNLMIAEAPFTAHGSGRVYSQRSGGHSVTPIATPIVFFPDTSQMISDIKVTIPDSFSSPCNSTSVELGPGMSGQVEVALDSVFVRAVSFTADPAISTNNDQTASGKTGMSPYLPSTRRIDGSFRSVQDQPMLLVTGGPIPIAEARENDANGIAKRLNDYVTVNGFVTASNQFGAPAYIQDATGGIAVYDFSFIDSVVIGDEVMLTGKVTQYNGLTELESVVIERKSSSGSILLPEDVTINQLLHDGAGGVELYESKLIRLHGVTVNTPAWTVVGSGTNYTLSDGADAIDVRVDDDVNFAGQPTPGGSFDIVAIVSQFQKTIPAIGGYQLLPRMSADILSAGPRILSNPVETDIQPRSVTLDWTTATDALSAVRYGKTEALELGLAQSNNTGREHSLTISNLEAGTIYKALAFSVAGFDTSFAAPMYFCTASETSTGEMNVYFNQGVDNSIYPVFPASGNTNLLDKLLDRIDAATHSIDFCLYSLSGSVGDTIADRLLTAKNRGVKIRGIFEADNASSNAIQQLRNYVPVILDNFDDVNAGAGLQHNKFFVIDARDRSSDLDDWVITGSWNPTDRGTNNDAQNMIEVQDQALAVVYTKEFEEMWGSSDENPHSSTSRFGVRKQNNTPHRFTIHGSSAELYFSPSDNTTRFLVSAAARAQHSIYFSILTFTRDDLANTLLDRHRSGVAVRGLFDNSSDQGSEFTTLQNGGVDVLLKKNLTGLLHHKYMIIDADAAESSHAPMVITGSHNWSNAAEYSNNENTFAVADARIARHYLQEWFKRYTEAGGTGTIVLGIERDSGEALTFALGQNYPNPVHLNGTIGTTIPFSIQNTGISICLAVYDVLGREVGRLAEGHFTAGQYRLQFDAAGLRPGLYRYQLTDGSRTLVRSFLVTR